MVQRDGVQGVGSVFCQCVQQNGISKATRCISWLCLETFQSTPLPSCLKSRKHKTQCWMRPCSHLHQRVLCDWIKASWLQASMDDCAAISTYYNLGLPLHQNSVFSTQGELRSWHRTCVLCSPLSASWEGQSERVFIPFPQKLFIT